MNEVSSGDGVLVATEGGLLGGFGDEDCGGKVLRHNMKSWEEEPLLEMARTSALKSVRAARSVVNSGSSGRLSSEVILNRLRETVPYEAGAHFRSKVKFL